ncbi:MAG: helix-turn-helix transcriptional regulator [Bacteroides sp.]|nr:helix-turn-helix transcriptional regulator [Bacteroides sp.]MCM1403804.1 helix-turn-helix transcriptional regulator [Bacteroides sp.]MCM1443544.1 helix-turn-helix transcriptional regulator [Muribaculum sp.]MCM1577121.1 helix-turn-helix transcriptional regulator [Bacteroides sp.]
MKRIEFYTFNSDVWCRTDTEHQKLTEDSQIVDMLLDELEVLYPKAYAALDKEYQKIEDFRTKRYRMVSRFIKCNFGQIDNILDISSTGKYVFECVSCPLRSECKWEGVICQPEFNSDLSKREKEIMKLIYDGMQVQEIAEKVYLSPHTIKNHIRNAFAKIGVHSISEFIIYANENGLYNDERLE